MKTKVADGRSGPLGASLTFAGIRFALFAPDVDGLTVEIRQDDRHEFLALARENDVWQIEVPGIDERALYRFVAQVGGRQHPVIDPFAESIVDKPWGEAGTEPSWCRMISHTFPWDNDRPPNHPWEEMVIYECHPRGFTRSDSSGVSAPGTFRGMRERLGYLADLGITTLELLPVFYFDECSNPRRNPETGAPLLNYWGYQPLSFFALKGSYASSLEPQEAANEFRELIKDAHQHRIEVILDVVFNHTGEIDSRTGLPGWLQLAPGTFYQMNGTGLVNATGCGNTININDPFTSELAIRALRHWVEHFHVDGFRYDLGGAFYRGADGHPIQSSDFVKRIFADPVLGNRKHIFEPWDAVGNNISANLPTEARRWSDDLRDSLRRLVNGHEASSGATAALFCQSRHNSINFITAHDGLTLRDCLSYVEKRNHANGESNCDGVDFNHSCNYGVEGDPAPPSVEHLRMRQARNMIALLLLAPGTPMILSGDECFGTQLGNNNGYCLDNPAGWFDWEDLNRHAALLQFTRQMIRLRQVLQRPEPLQWVAEQGEQGVLRLHNAHGLQLIANLSEHPVPRRLKCDAYWIFSTAAPEGQEFSKRIVTEEPVPARSVEICQGG